jgi:coenzyme F420-reducing hydrogenase gamma subunit
MKKQSKPKLAFFDFTDCEGCQLQFANLGGALLELLELVDIVNFREIMSEAAEDYDIAFIEGAISTQSEINKLKEIRKKSKKLIALGSGAVNGFPSNQRNKFDAKKKKQIQKLIEKFHQNKTIEPLNKFVKVDDEINGCPVEEKLLIEKIEGYLKT